MIYRKQITKTHTNNTPPHTHKTTYTHSNSKQSPVILHTQVKPLQNQKSARRLQKTTILLKGLFNKFIVMGLKKTQKYSKTCLMGATLKEDQNGF